MVDCVADVAVAAAKKYPDPHLHEHSWQLQSPPYSHFGQSGHIFLLPLPPLVKTIKVWSDEATAALQDFFEYTDQHMFRSPRGTISILRNYILTMTSYISKYVDNVVITKTKSFSNQKALMSWMAHSRAKKMPFGQVTMKPTMPELELSWH